MSPAVLVAKKKVKNPPLDIHTLGDRVLRKPAKRIAKVDASVRKLIEDMLTTMYSADGIGLAAPQVGVHKQLMVIDLELDDPSAPPFVFINPVIRKAGKKIEADQEGCLSIPGVYMDVTRPTEITVAYKDETGRPRTLEASGLLARAIQHEMDHLNGVMLVDRVDYQFKLTQELKKNGFVYKSVRPV